jgi:L-ascorbate metabolism protein UlaG (beta-lactamase superfamily)
MQRAVASLLLVLTVASTSHSYTMSSTHWKVHSAWSKAGIGTNIVLELRAPPSAKCSDVSKKKMPRIAFDMGSTPVFDAAIPAKFIFLSHGHVDHVGGVFSHARAHSVACGGLVNKYVLYFVSHKEIVVTKHTVFSPQ